mmetsp:Transcript_33899/g.34534  ORF Transcript_33899/g.34534 Transcript_33899/m.34534 type:complete len:352 (-) Transcript_33899:51-1106(-)
MDEARVEPTDGEVKDAVIESLKGVDLLTVTKKSLREKVECLHGWNLGSRKHLINETLEVFLEAQSKQEAELDAQSSDNDDNDDNDSDLKVETKKEKGKGKGGFGAEVQLSTELSELLEGKITLPRTQVTKQVWAYIKANKLQNPKNGREILTDAALEKVFKRKKVDMFLMTKLLSQHMKSVSQLQEESTALSGGLDSSEEEDDGEVEDDAEEIELKRRKLLKERRHKIVPGKGSEWGRSRSFSHKEGLDADQRKRKREAGKKRSKEEEVTGRGLQTPLRLSKGLGDILGVYELSRPQVVKKMWEYIKEKGLQNPKDKREIFLDKPFQKLFQTEKCTMFTMNIHLKEHLSSL